FKRVPQQFLLRYCSMFITHGGMNSVKESIMEAVPMLVYPIDIDQVGNARKVTYKKMGLLGELKSDSKREIERKIRKMLDENDQFKQNIQAFRDQVLATRNVEKIIPIIEATAPIS
ncbi:MAG: nucleotide disphospho-sugar-binding domain-containing protein, partial [Bacteroidota bacterium]